MGDSMKAFVMPDDEFDASTKEGREAQRSAIVQALRRFNPRLNVPSGGARGGCGAGRILYKGTIHKIK